MCCRELYTEPKSTLGIPRLQVVQAFVRQAMGYVDQAPDKETRVELIKTLQTVTEGKVISECLRRYYCMKNAQT